MKQLMVAVIAIAALGLGACSSDGPAVKAAKKLVAEANDERKAANIRESGGPQEIRCDAGTPRLLFVDSMTGDALVFFYRKDNGRVVCFDRPGFVSRGPEMGKVLMPVNRNVVEEILRQPCPPSPPPAPTPPPVPDLSEGPCCGR